jgi:hypothetical protein
MKECPLDNPVVGGVINIQIEQKEWDIVKTHLEQGQSIDGTFAVDETGREFKGQVIGVAEERVMRVLVTSVDSLQ